MFTKTLDERLATADKPVHVYAIHPGFINSNLYTQTWYAKFITLTTGFMFKVIMNHLLLYILKLNLVLLTTERSPRWRTGSLLRIVV